MFHLILFLSLILQIVAQENCEVKICAFPAGDNFANETIPPENVPEAEGFCCEICDTTADCTAVHIFNETCRLFANVVWEEVDEYCNGFVIVLDIAKPTVETTPVTSQLPTEETTISSETEITTDQTGSESTTIEMTTSEVTTTILPSTTLEAVTRDPTTTIITTTTPTTTTTTTTTAPTPLDPCRYQPDFTFIPFPGDCTKYYLCFRGVGYEQICGDDLEFDCGIQECWFPQLVTCCDELRTTLRFD